MCVHRRKKGFSLGEPIGKEGFYMEISMISALYPPLEMGRGGRPALQVGRGRNGIINIFILKLSFNNRKFSL